MIQFSRIGTALLVFTGCYFVTISAELEQYAIYKEQYVQVYQAGAFVSSESCYDAVLASDEDGDGRVTREEYVSLARELSPPGLIGEGVAFNDLPLAFTNTFRHLACLCQIASLGGNPTDSQCCVGSNANIRVPDPPSGDEGTPEDVAYLYSVCSLTSEAANSILTSPFPTARETSSPATSPPTAFPTSPPTPESADTPTVSPTVDPVATGPTSLPTMPPDTPTVSPTTTEPTQPPVPTFSPAPTRAPTLVPSLPPAAIVPTDTATSLASVMYSIAVSNGQVLIDSQGFEQQYLLDLSAAMDELAMLVAGETLGRRLRELQVALTVLLPTEIGNREEIECPADMTEDGDLCQDITALITLSMPPDADANSSEVREAISRYESNLLDAIINGDLQSELLKIRVDTPVRILTGLQPEGGVVGESESLSNGARAGIAVSIAFVVALIGIGLLVGRRGPQNQNNSRKIDYAAYHGEDSADAIPSAKPDGSVNDSLYTDDAVQLATDTGAAVTLGAAQADYGKHSQKTLEAMEAGEDHLAEPGADEYDESSSNAGSSGWSSSAGLSSLNTGSMDDSMDAAAAAGATLAALGVASGLARKAGKNKETSGLLQIPDSGDDIPPSSREELDRLIEAGDWAAVGATAALLAAASDSQSLSSSRSRATDRSSGGGGSIDAARAAELDQLVDAGDWEGVVLAAAKYQTEESSNIEGTVGASVESSGDSMTGTGTGGSPSMSTSVSDSPSKIAKRAEIRAEVEALVRRVVPEEIDNVDEMMNQFKGREEELVETLRTMQERAAAQKARAASQKAAKVKAKQTVQRGVVPGAQAAAQKIASPQPVPGTPDSSEISAFISPESLKEQRSALELAIERGDWDAVGRAAAMIGDQSIGSPNSEDFTALNRSIDSDIPKERDQLSGEDKARAEELDDLINVGDWSGVVSKALMYSGSPEKKESKSKITDEEEEALQQAEFWMQIAEQKKAEGATDAGALDAAEWAIQRSLTQLKEADKKEPRTHHSDEEDEV